MVNSDTHEVVELPQCHFRANVFSHRYQCDADHCEPLEGIVFLLSFLLLVFLLLVFIFVFVFVFPLVEQFSTVM